MNTTRPAAALLAFVMASGIIAGAPAHADGPSASMKAWTPDLTPIRVGVNITFRATGADLEGMQGFEWDFDGDGEPDAASPADRQGAASSSGSIVHAYDAPTSVLPAVRAVSTEGFVSPWDVYNINGSPVTLVIGDTAAPKVNMDRWSPFSVAGADGTAGTKFSFSATATSEVGILRFEWDFDTTTAIAGSPKSTGGSADHLYSFSGSWAPKVRAVDANGLPSQWAGYGKETLDVVNPKLQAALKSSSGPLDRLPVTVSFVATVGSKAKNLAWDFDGDGTIDATGESLAATHTYSGYGRYLPSVTVTNAFGTKVTMVPLDSKGQPAYLEILPKQPVAIMNAWSPYSQSGPDGKADTLFTFSASSVAFGKAQRFEWDFDGDGKVDATTAAKDASATTKYAYGRQGNFVPQVRVVDGAGQVSEWSHFVSADRTVQLDLASAAAEPSFCDGKMVAQLIASGKYRVLNERSSQKKLITGTGGDDLLIAGRNGSIVRGLGGNDCIIGGPGNDVLLGGDGNDQIFGNGGNDRVDDGSGPDLCVAVGKVANCE